MSIRVGMRAMARPPMGAPEAPPGYIFAEDFSDWDVNEGRPMPDMDLIFSEDFSGWP